MKKNDFWRFNHVTNIDPIFHSEDSEYPQFSEPLYVGRPNIGNRERFLQRIGEMLDRRWFSNDGPLVKEFEAAVASYVGVKHCVALCNATVGLEIAIRALGLKGEVIVPSYTFIATAHALSWQGIRPVFADIDPRTHNINPSAVERLITTRTTGIIGVHVWGRPCDTEELEKIGKNHGLKVMYDAAHAFGSSRKGVMVGNFGECEVYSFHATKFLNSFEGGAIVTNNASLAEKIRLMRNFGFSGYDNVVSLGVNGKMSEPCAAMGLTSLESVGELIAVNEHNNATYRNNLKDIPGIRLLERGDEGRHNYQYIVIEVEESRFGRTRDELVELLHAQNVIARKYFWPGCHRMQPYAEDDPEAGNMLPETERVAARVIVLPTGETIDPESISKICKIIRKSHRQ
jgi:dTDP-4-amino-4,6-dideoxygalactose transaminase